MTPVTLPPKLARVYIILQMTGDALAHQLYFTGRLAMAVRTGVLRMRAGQGKAGLFAVVKTPDRPAIG
jgi:hypothetical protein